MGLAVQALVGDEPVAQRQALAKARAGASSWERVNLANVSPEEATMGSLLMDPERPVVRVLENYPKWSAAERKRFVATLDSLPEGLRLVLLLKQLGAKDPLRAALPAEALVEMTSPSAGRFTQWLRQHAKALGGEIDQDAAAEMVKRLGENTERLSSELEKLIVAAAEGKVTRALVEALTIAEEQAEAWPWVEAIFAGDQRKVFADLALLERNSAPLALLGAFSSRLMGLAWVNLGCEAEAVGMKPYPWRKANDSVREGWNAARVARSLERLLRYERNLRGQSSLPEWTLMAQFCAEQLADRP